MSNLFIKKYKNFKGIVFIQLLHLKRFFRIVLGKGVYYVIGDSHTLNFLHEAFIINHIGPATAYKLNFEKSTTNSKKKVLNILENIYKYKPINVIFVFGELDSRIHIFKISKEKKIDVNTLIVKTVESYIEFLKFVKKEFPLINIYVFNILPPGEEENIYNFSYYADIDKRREIAIKMNKVLQNKVDSNNYRFINIYNRLINRKGERKKKYVFDDVHFNKKIIPYILESIITLNKNEKH